MCFQKVERFLIELGSASKGSKKKCNTFFFINKPKFCTRADLFRLAYLSLQGGLLGLQSGQLLLERRGARRFRRTAPGRAAAESAAAAGRPSVEPSATAPHTATEVQLHERTRCVVGRFFGGSLALELLLRGHLVGVVVVVLAAEQEGELRVVLLLGLRHRFESRTVPDK
jgi:hypothetical protein